VSVPSISFRKFFYRNCQQYEECDRGKSKD
jgi:hypothetical protein